MLTETLAKRLQDIVQYQRQKLIEERTEYAFSLCKDRLERLSNSLLQNKFHLFEALREDCLPASPSLLVNGEVEYINKKIKAFIESFYTLKANYSQHKDIARQSLQETSTMSIKAPIGVVGLYPNNTFPLVSLFGLLAKIFYHGNVGFVRLSPYLPAFNACVVRCFKEAFHKREIHLISSPLSAKIDECFFYAKCDSYIMWQRPSYNQDDRKKSNNVVEEIPSNKTRYETVSGTSIVVVFPQEKCQLDSTGKDNIVKIAPNTLYKIVSKIIIEKKYLNSCHNLANDIVFVHRSLYKEWMNNIHLLSENIRRPASDRREETFLKEDECTKKENPYHKVWTTLKDELKKDQYPIYHCNDVSIFSFSLENSDSLIKALNNISFPFYSLSLIQFVFDDVDDVVRLCHMLPSIYIACLFGENMEKLNFFAQSISAKSFFINETPMGDAFYKSSSPVEKVLSVYDIPLNDFFKNENDSIFQTKKLFYIQKKEKKDFTSFFYNSHY